MFKILFSRNKKIGFLALFFLVLYAAYNPALSKLIQYNMSVAEGSSQLNLGKLLTINIAVLIVLSFINWLSQYFSIKFYSLSQDNLNQLFFTKLVESNDVNYKTSEIVKVFNNDIPLVIGSYIPSIISLLYFILSFSFGAILIFSLNKIILIYLIAIACCALIVSKKMSNRISPSQKRYNDSLGNNSEILLDIFENSIIRKVFKLNPFMRQRFSALSQDSAQHLFTLKKQNAIITFSNDSFAWLLQIGMYIIGALLIHQGELTFAGLIAITQAAGTITTPIFWFSNTLADIYSSKEIRKKMLEVINEDRKKEHLRLDKVENIEFEKVIFSFPDNHKIGPISFNIEQGSKQVMIGKNGSGKSTIYSALMLEPVTYSGKILMNNREIKNFSINDYLNEISVVTQKTKLYTGSVLENIVAFSEKINTEKIDQIKPLFINENSNFLNKAVSNLSGGQQQLVTIARALYKNSSLLLLDEPFAALDKNMEKLVLDYLLNLRNQTLLITIHHYDAMLLEKFDDIIKIDDSF